MRQSPRLVCLGVLAVVSISCANATPAPAHVRAGSRLGWDQVATSADEVKTLHFVLLLDEAQAEMNLQDVSCGTERGPKGFSCSAVLPAIALGPHVLRVSARTAKGNASSPPSEPMNVIVE
jgi:hypothetical protein